MSEYPKQRRYPRFATENVHGSFALSVDAQVLNMSLSGLAVRTTTQLHVGRSYNFSLGREADTVEVSGRVVWCRLSGTERQPSGDVMPVYKAGIAFDDVLSQKAGQLLEFMEKNVLLDLRRRIFGRFRAAEDEAVVVESKVEFQVRQISLSGMLIETVVAPQLEDVLAMEIRLDGGRLSASGRIVNIREAPAAEGDSPRHLVGVEFRNATLEQRQILARFIREELEKKIE